MQLTLSLTSRSPFTDTDKDATALQNAFYQLTFQEVQLGPSPSSPPLHDRSRKYDALDFSSADQVSCFLQDMDMDISSLPETLSKKLQQAGQMIDEVYLDTMYVSKKNIQTLKTIFQRVRKLSCLALANDALPLFHEYLPIEELRVLDCWNFKDEDFSVIGNLQSLKSLTLRRCKKIRENSFLHLRKLHSLVELTVFGCAKEISDEGIRALSPLSKLQVLSLSKTKVNDAVTQLLYKFPELQCVKLVNASTSLKAIKQLLYSHPSLRKFNGEEMIKCCDAEFLDEFKNHNRDDVNIFYLQGCQKLTDISIERLFSHFPNLQDVELHNCRQLTNKTLDHILSLGDGLKKIRLFGFKKIEAAHARQSMASIKAKGIRIEIYKGPAMQEWINRPLPLKTKEPQRKEVKVKSDDAIA